MNLMLVIYLMCLDENWARSVPVCLHSFNWVLFFLWSSLWWIRSSFTERKAISSQVISAPWWSTPIEDGQTRPVGALRLRVLFQDVKAQSGVKPFSLGISELCPKYLQMWFIRPWPSAPPLGWFTVWPSRSENQHLKRPNWAVWAVWHTHRWRSHPHEMSAEAAHLPVVVSEFDVPAGLQDLPVLQPGELGLGLAPRLAGEDGGGAHRPWDRLWGLNKLCRSWKK